MAKTLMRTSVICLAILACGLAWAMNSLVNADDIKKMKKAKISDAVIKVLIAEQTCSMGADSLIMLKRAGADDDMLKTVIFSDRYKSPSKADLSLEQIEILKKAGFSDEVIMQMLNSRPVKRVVDEHGNKSVVYGTRRHPEPDTTTPSQPQGTYHINIEKVERP